MRLKKCVLSFLRKLVRVEMSLMSDGNALQSRGQAMGHVYNKRSEAFELCIWRRMLKISWKNKVTNMSVPVE